MKTFQIFVLFLCVTFSLEAQRPTQLTVTTFTDPNYTDVEPAYDYNFVPPVKADILSENPADYTPDMDNRYFMSIFGPRHKSVSTSNIGYFVFVVSNSSIAYFSRHIRTFVRRLPFLVVGPHPKMLLLMLRSRRFLLLKNFRHLIYL